MVLRKAMILSLVASSLQLTFARRTRSASGGLGAGCSSLGDCDDDDAAPGDAAPGAASPSTDPKYTVDGPKLQAAHDHFAAQDEQKETYCQTADSTWSQRCTDLLGYSTTDDEPYAKDTALVKARLRSEPTLLSGGFEGADVLFGTAAMDAGHYVVHILGPFNKVSVVSVKGIDTEEQHLCCLRHWQLKHTPVYNQWSRVLEKRERSWNAHNDYLALRNMFQVQDVHIVYAVAYRLPKEDPKEPGVQIEWNERSLKQDIAGGTGTAVQAYINRFADGGDPDAKLWFFDDCKSENVRCLKDEKTNMKWSTWDFEEKEWAPLEEGAVPPLPGTQGQERYAGIGGRFPTDIGKTKIKQLFPPKTKV